MEIYTIYGSGDVGTRELRDLFTRLGVAHHVVDIRAEVAGSTDPLSYLVSRGLTTVPQVFGADHVHIGNFEAALKHWKNT